jgi:hypothetical protein
MAVLLQMKRSEAVGFLQRQQLLAACVDFQRSLLENTLVLVPVAGELPTLHMVAKTVPGAGARAARPRPRPRRRPRLAWGRRLGADGGAAAMQLACASGLHGAAAAREQARRLGVDCDWQAQVAACCPLTRYCCSCPPPYLPAGDYPRLLLDNRQLVTVPQLEDRLLTDFDKEQQRQIFQNFCWRLAALQSVPMLSKAQVRGGRAGGACCGRGGAMQVALPSQSRCSARACPAARAQQPCAQNKSLPSPPALPCPALPCPALPCPALPCPALRRSSPRCTCCGPSWSWALTSTS